jgi:hypothetical protein
LSIIGVASPACTAEPGPLIHGPRSQPIAPSARKIASTLSITQSGPEPHTATNDTAKTVTVTSTLGPWTDTAPYHEITDHHPAADTGEGENTCG